MIPAPGQRLGRYLLKAVIGRGGMAEIWEVFDDRLHRTVAVKVIAAQISADPEFGERFEREARLAASLEHAHILPIYDFGIEENTAYLVMPLLRGGSLRDHLKNEVPVADALAWLRDLASALDHAHARGVLHRDVTPKNVLFDASGRLFLCDFGLAKSAEIASELTAAGVVIGTPQYMSPEQGSGRPVDARSDQYALGTIAYRLLTGRLPFIGDSAVVVLQKTLNEVPAPASSVSPRLSPAVDEVLATVLAKDPKARFSSCCAFVETLARASEVTPATGTVMPPAGPEAPTVTMTPTPATARPAGSASADAPTRIISQTAATAADGTRPTTTMTPATVRASGSRRPGVSQAEPPVTPAARAPITADGSTPTSTTWVPTSRSHRLGLVVLVGLAAIGLAVITSLAVKKGTAVVAGTRGAPEPQAASPVPPTLVPAAVAPLESPTPGDAAPTSAIPTGIPPEGQPTLPQPPRPTLPQPARPTLPQPPRPTLPPPIPPAGAFEERREPTPPLFVPSRTPRPVLPTREAARRPPVQPAPYSGTLPTEPAVKPDAATREAAGPDYTFRARRGVQINVEPSQARVFLDGTYIGISDDWDGHGGGAYLTFPRGSRHRLRFAHEGRRDLVVDVVVGAEGKDDIQDVELELEKGTPGGPTGPAGKVSSPDYKTPGPLRFAVEPADAEITLDGRALGPASRYREEDLTLTGPAVHDVVLTAPGYKPRAVRVLAGGNTEPGKPVIVKVKLKRS